MKFKVLRGFCVKAGRDANKGDVIDLPEPEARLWVLQGRLAPLDDGVVRDPTKDGLVTTEGLVTTRDPKRRRRG